MREAGKRFGLIGLLYVSQAVPLGFFIVAAPAILRDRGVALEHIGLLSVIALPWLIKFAWAPLVDRFGSRRHGHYRSWLIPLQTASVACVLVLAALGPVMPWLAVVGALFMLFAATQDVAVDGLAVRSLRFGERGPGNGVQVGGYYLGQVLGGGLMLVLFAQLGWTMALLCMAAFLVLPLPLVLGYREPAGPERSTRIDFAAITRFVRRSGWTWLLVCLLYRSAEAMAFTMLQPLLVDHGFSLARIGVLMGTAGSVASFGGAMLGGVLLVWLGRKPALVAFGLLQAVAISGLAAIARGGLASGAVYLLVVAAAFAGGMATTALYTHMMDRAESRTAATDFTLQQSICALGPLTAAGLSGFSAANLGYTAHFVLCALVQVLVVGVILRWLAVPARVVAPSEAS